MGQLLHRAVETDDPVDVDDSYNHSKPATDSDFSLEAHLLSNLSIYFHFHRSFVVFSIQKIYGVTIVGELFSQNNLLVINY